VSDLSKKLIEHFEAMPKEPCDECGKQINAQMLAPLIRNDENSKVVCFPCRWKIQEKIMSKLFAPAPKP